MEAVQEVKFGRDLITDASLGALFHQRIWDVHARIQSPGAIGMVGVGNRTEIVVKTDVDIQSASNPRNLSAYIDHAAQLKKHTIWQSGIDPRPASQVMRHRLPCK